MHDLVSYNGTVISASDALIAALSAAALYGKGVFTTVAVEGGHTDWWPEHWSRISQDAKKLGIDIGAYNEASILAEIDRLLSANSVDRGKVRVSLFDDSPNALWLADIPDGTSTMIATSDRPPPADYFRLTISPCLVNS
ncbi:MAG TPA: aminotransferase class IV, partial [Pyrinomonadaceae bacterium]|nr:aminotransferase class IV [Pyrinomonadaceae bacterium]